MRRVVVITGGARGIGAALVQGFLREKYLVSTCDMLDFEPATTSQQHHEEVHTFKCDISVEEQVKQFVASTSAAFPNEKHWAGLINCAAIATPYMPATQPQGADDEDVTPLAKIDIEAFRRFMDVNVTGQMLLMKHTAPFLQPQNIKDPESTGGSIINISSTRAEMSEPNSEGYAASKGAIESLTHAVALSNPRLRCNAIRVGWINAVPESVYKPTAADHAFHPAGRVGRPEDVVEMCLFLIDGKKSGFVTGSVLTLDGGVTRKMIYP